MVAIMRFWVVCCGSGCWCSYPVMVFEFWISYPVKVSAEFLLPCGFHWVGGDGVGFLCLTLLGFSLSR